MSITYTANIVIGLHEEDLWDWEAESKECLEDLFEYFHHSGVYGYLYESTEDFASLTEGDGGELDKLMAEFEEVTGMKPQVLLVVDSY